MNKERRNVYVGDAAVQVDNMLSDKGRVTLVMSGGGSYVGTEVTQTELRRLIDNLSYFLTE